MYEVIFDKKGAKAYVKIRRVLSQRNSVKRGLWNFLVTPAQQVVAY